jgi:hypothetical protein
LGTADELCIGAGPNDPNPVCVTKAQLAAPRHQHGVVAGRVIKDGVNLGDFCRQPRYAAFD